MSNGIEVDFSKACSKCLKVSCPLDGATKEELEATLQETKKQMHDLLFNTCYGGNIPIKDQAALIEAQIKAIEAHL